MNFILSYEWLKNIPKIISVPGIMWLCSFIFGLHLSLCISALCSLCRQLQQCFSAGLLIVLGSRFYMILKEFSSH